MTHPLFFALSSLFLKTISGLTTPVPAIAADVLQKTADLPTGTYVTH
ncbi:MAG: hypothetical protein IJS13_07445 [Paludibacteraceae bacterium]|nr:hypothetical protein [Paludibacteraceae bacterium]